jgi:hypothetical protein
LEAAALWYEDRERGLGSEFLDEYQNTLDRILEEPDRRRKIRGDNRKLLKIRVQDETNSPVLLASGVVARSLQTAAGMCLARASPESKSPARLSLILNANWN